METEQRTDNRKKKIIALAALLAAALIGVLLFFLLSKNDLMAVDIRIRRMVGTVNLHNEKGKELSLAERMRLNSGQRLKTAEESLVMLSLDETRLITLEESSKAQIKAAGKKLEFDLEEGELFFNVTEKLEEVESFDIRTSTMLCGIRGTSGFVGEDETGHETLMVTDGIVAVTGEHPVTHERIQTLVFAGQQVTIYLDDEAEGDARISFRLQRFKEEDLPALALDAIRKDEKLQSRITQATGFSTKKLVELADVTSFKGVSMYGQAVEELSAAGIEDAIPLMGRTAKEMVATANRAAETAGQDLPLEIAIIKGMRGVLDTAKAAGCDAAETSALMTGSSDCVDATVGKAREAGLSGDDLVGVAQTVTDTLSSAVGQMKQTALTTREITGVVDAITEVYNGAIETAVSNAQTAAPAGGAQAADKTAGQTAQTTGQPSAQAIAQAVTQAVNEASGYARETVSAEMQQASSGEETVAALLGTGAVPAKAAAKRQPRRRQETPDRGVRQGIRRRRFPETIHRVRAPAADRVLTAVRRAAPAAARDRDPGADRVPAVVRVRR